LRQRLIDHRLYLRMSILMCPIVVTDPRGAKNTSIHDWRISANYGRPRSLESTTIMV
jgi:hypothetical protein